MRRLLAYLCLLALLAPGLALAQEAGTPTVSAVSEIPLNDKQVLVPDEGPGWKLVDKTDGQEKHLILPAFHPELSHPVMEGNHLAYVGLTKNGARHQLGCITYDIAKGKVLNRQDSPLFAREGQAIAPPRLGDGEETVTCVLSGDRCASKGGACAAAEESITLNFLPGSLAHKDLKSVKRGAKGHGKSMQHKSKGSPYKKQITPRSKGNTGSKTSAAKTAHRKAAQS